MSRRPRQLPLSLSERPRWGGRRAGAGRKRQPGAPVRLPHVSRGGFGRPLPAHVTLRLCSDLPSLRSVPIVHEIERTFAAGCARQDFRLVHYSLQGNHAHLIVEARDREALGRGMKSIAARLARAVNRVSGRTGRVLADRYHLRLLPTPREVHHALRYVLLNSRRHAAAAGTALRAAVRLDPASSARWFDGWKRWVPSASKVSAAPNERPPVARARTWLLAVGWRRCGLLDPADVPG
jgi:REP element-mobilizing transposase RayT